MLIIKYLQRHSANWNKNRWSVSLLWVWIVPSFSVKNNSNHSIDFIIIQVLKYEKRYHSGMYIVQCTCSAVYPNGMTFHPIPTNSYHDICNLWRGAPQKCVCVFPVLIHLCFISLLEVTLSCVLMVQPSSENRERLKYAELVFEFKCFPN